MVAGLLVHSRVTNFCDWFSRIVTHLVIPIADIFILLDNAVVLAVSTMQASDLVCAEVWEDCGKRVLVGFAVGLLKLKECLFPKDFELCLPISSNI